jgi:hypothetical protein
LDEANLEELYPEFYEDPAYLKKKALQLINQTDAEKLRDQDPDHDSDSGEQLFRDKMLQKTEEWLQRLARR